MTNAVSNGNATAAADSDIWKNPYLLGFIAVTVIAVLPTLFSIAFVCRQLHLFNYLSLFLVEMAVGSLTTEAIVHLLPALILPDKSIKPGVPAYFPYLATVTAGVCVLHALDTASVVFFGRRQSTSHAMEWREANADATATRAGEGGHVTHNSSDQGSVIDQQLDRKQEGSLRDVNENDDWSISDEGSNKFYYREDRELRESMRMIDESVATEEGSIAESVVDRHRSTLHHQHHHQAAGEITIRQAIRNPRKCLQHGPYRLCSILSAGSVLHSFADGVAIGAAFVKTWDYGLHLSVSVGMHELAHKVADFAVLTASGFHMKAVLLLNVCYYASNLLGVVISVPLSLRSDEVRAWITTVATAVFVYISLVTMSSMVRRNYNPRNIPAFFIGNVGMTSGYLLIMLASLLEFYV